MGLPLFHLHPAECVGSRLWTLARRPDASSGQFCSAWHTSRNFLPCLGLAWWWGRGYGILVLEIADYVLTGSGSKLHAVVTLSKGLRKREREGKRHSPATDGWWWLLCAGWGRGNRALTAVSQPWTVHGVEAGCQCCILDFEGQTLALIWADSQRLFLLCCWSLWSLHTLIYSFFFLTWEDGLPMPQP